MTRVFVIVAALVIFGQVVVLSLVVLKARNEAANEYVECRPDDAGSGVAAIGGDITMVNHLGQTVSSDDIFTKPSLVYFGYTFCPDVCPLDNARNIDAVDLLDAEGIDVTPLFISIDPERDTPEVMAEYVEIMHPRMIGLTGSAAQVKFASETYKTYFRKNGDGQDYLMDHSTFTYLVMPGEGFVEFYRRTETPEQLASSIACFAS